MKVTLYEMLCKRDSHDGLTPKDLWYKYNIEQSIVNMTLPGPVVLNAAHRVDSVPYCSDVGRYFRIVNRHSWYLEPGQQHTRIVRHRFMKTLIREAWENLATNEGPVQSVGGWTRNFLLVWQSALVHNKNVDPQDILADGVSALGCKYASNQVTVSDAMLDVTVRHHVNYVQDSNGSRTVYEQPYPYKLDLADADEEHMGDADDQPGQILAS